jgi:ribonuclease PH
MIDVSLKEEGICQNVLNFAFMSTEDKSELVMTDCQGAGINLDFYEQCMEHARSVCATYRLFMRVSAEKYIQSRFRVCN